MSGTGGGPTRGAGGGFAGRTGGLPAIGPGDAPVNARTGAPPPGAIRPYAFPAVEEGRLGNGMEVRFVHKLPFPIVTAMVVVRAGETAAPEGSAGLAVLAGDALEGGTVHRTSRQLAKELEAIGASFGVAAGWDSTTAALSCMADHLPGALPLLAEMVQSPAFTDTDFERYRSQRLAAAVHRRMDPASLAVDAHARFVFGEGDTYARPLGGTESSLGGLGPGDAHAFVANRYGPSQAALVVAGDLEPADALALAEQSFSGWSPGVEPAPEAKVSARRAERSVHVVHRPGSVQSEIRVGHVGVARSVEDYFPLTVLNLILGGSFSSRLNLNLRERNGFTYGVRSSFAARKGPGPFAVSTSVENAVTGAATEEIFREIEAIAEQGPTGEEVEAATSYLAGVFPLRLETTGQIASRIAEMVVYDLPGDYYHTYRDRVRGVTRAQAAESARRHVRPGELRTVVVGNADEVAGPLEALGIGPVVVHRDDG